ncbi:MAG: hypothetical protein ACRETN_03285, partial [Nevskiales bacterium]
VMDKVTVAAELCLQRSLPGLIAGSALLRPQDLAQGSYFGGRKAEDGRIAWRRPAAQIHNLVRAVTRPYPGAFSDTPHGRLRIWRSLQLQGQASGEPALLVDGNKLLARCGDGGLLRILAADLDGRILDADSFRAIIGPRLALADLQAKEPLIY